MIGSDDPSQLFFDHTFAFTDPSGVVDDSSRIEAPQLDVDELELQVFEPPSNEYGDDRVAHFPICDVPLLAPGIGFPEIEGFPGTTSPPIAPEQFRHRRHELKSSANHFGAHLERGDLIFGRGSATVSKVISNVSGHWSHVAIYLGVIAHHSDYDCLAELSEDETPTKQPMVIDYRGSIRIYPLAELLVQYPDGVAMARPFVERGDRSDIIETAISWAEAQRAEALDQQGNTPDSCGLAGCAAHSEGNYNNADLVMCAVLLLRARHPLVRTLSGLTQARIQQLESFVGPLDEHPELYHLEEGRWTCSSFVFSAFEQNGERAIEPKFVAGTKRGWGGDVTYIQEIPGQSPAAPPGGDELVGPVTAPLLSEAETEASPPILTMASNGLAVLRKLAKLAKSLRGDLDRGDIARAAVLAAVVGPNDIWASTSLSNHHMLFAGQKAPNCIGRRPDQRAISTCVDCIFQQANQDKQGEQG